jgi:nucleoside-diphosphate-sugar epimerase
MEKILVTGANGFVGKAVCAELTARRFQVAAAVRDTSLIGSTSASPTMEAISVGNIDGETDWSRALSGCSGLIHLAARAHILNDRIADPLAAFRETNVAGSVQLARCAARAGVKRFVFVSSVGVNGNMNTRPFTESDTPSPAEAYAVSKLEAEQALAEATAGSAMELVIVRPPLVYGPECPGNFLRLLKLLSSGVPLPFGAMRNKRSFVGVWTLADFLVTCVVSKQAAGEVFLISDMEDVTLPDLLRGLAVGMGKKAPLFSLSPALLRALAGAAGKAGLFEKLCGNLTVDASHARTALGWNPPVPLAEGLRRTGSWYANR